MKTALPTVANSSDSQSAYDSHTSRIYISPPDITELERQAVLRAVASGWVAPQGPELDAFEAELAKYNERSCCVALSSGTAALHLGLLALNVGKGDLVLTSTMTFAATANAIIYTGAQPVFIDSDGAGNMSPEILAEAIRDLESAGEFAKVVLPVDLLGRVADHKAIGPIAANHGAAVMSDAAESLGSRLAGKPSGAYGQVAAISFNGNKVMTTSGGGALLTDNPTIAERARYLATQARQPVVHYEHTEIGYNYRLSNVLAALGRAQLGRLESMIEARRQNRLRYAELFAGIPGVTLLGASQRASDYSAQRENCWLTSALVDPALAKFTRDRLLDELDGHNIEARPLWKPMHLQPAYQHYRSYIDGTSDRLFRTGISLPSGSTLGSNDWKRIGSAIAHLDGPAT